ncbi:hypothetical protein BOO69_05250 [Sulfitobacter alexandrii]|uniref:Beta-lactamase-related domain-containing protein n=1 Tax=Sulfitobacter alexandrii TaxID=1917485 RepID=A0A1J0WFI3_9RHOB|nr:serine hydrolase domain-containing protein [Sulfitobacter alexandrii]APE42894.1 hypothetical protein BOO69_05250 [Sulfitobacter alexandrii]
MKTITLTAAILLMARAAFGDVPERVEQAFRDWAEETGTGTAVLSLWRDGVHRRDVTLGTEAGMPVVLGSLSKTVTALCAVTLVQDGSWTWQTTAREVLGHGSADVTLAGLMTHSAGLAPDETQGLGLRDILDRPDAQARIARRALDRAAQEGTPGRFHYNNENYEIIGAMIATETGSDYADHCTDAVLGPAGVSGAATVPGMAGLLPAGGWQMPVQDFARLMEWGFGPEGPIGSDPDAWPAVDAGGGASYGAGMISRPFGGGRNYWHFGLLCYPGRAEAAAYAVRFANGWMAVAGVDGCLGWDRLFALDAAIGGAVFE